MLVCHVLYKWNPAVVVHCKIAQVRNDDWCPRTFQKITICLYYFWMFYQWRHLYIFLLQFCLFLHNKNRPLPVFYWDENNLVYYILSSRKKIHCEICKYFTKEGPISMIHLNSKVIFKGLNYLYCSLSWRVHSYRLLYREYLLHSYDEYLIAPMSTLYAHRHCYNR